MDFGEVGIKEANAFGNFYIEKMETERDSLKYFLSEDVILDWFGQTVKGEKNVIVFLKKTLSSVNHVISDFRPATKIGFRDTHVVKIPKIPKVISLGLLSPPRIINQKSQTKTPKKQIRPSTSAITFRNKEKPKEHGQGDGCHNDTNLDVSPAKRFKSSPTDIVENIETVEDECVGIQKVRYITSEGAIEFHKPSTKKLQTETKWRRPCKLSVAYSSTNCNNDYCIYLIIYEGNIKCRRNLMKEFEAEEPPN